MSGHSHWATIKRKKGASDAKRGQLYTRLAREIVIAAKEGGGEQDTNFRLRLAIEKARDQNMPKDSIDRAIKRGTGDLKDGAVFESMTYEGYAPHGVAVVVECVSDNRNRTVAELRHALAKSGGNLGELGSVAWQFKRASVFTVSGANVDFDKVFELAVEGGADDVTEDDGSFEIVGPVEAFKSLSDALRKAGIHVDEAGLRYLPNQEMELNVDQTLQVLRFIESVEEMEDVQNVYSNLRISDEAIAAMEAE